MPSVLMDAQRRRIESLLAAGLSPKTIATEEEVHLATVYRYRKNLLAHGSALIPFHQKLGRPRSLNALHLMALEHYSSINPTFTSMKFNTGSGIIST